MSFIKRLTNLGKGMWRVNMGPRDPDDEKRVKALQQELSRLEAEAAELNAGGSSAGGSSTGGTATRSTRPTSRLVDEATPEELLDAKLLILADQLREGSIDRDTYDRRCEALIAEATADQGEDADPTPVKRTL